MGSSQQCVVVAFAGFTAQIYDYGDKREITITRGQPLGPWVYHEVTLASLAACVERFTRPSSLGHDADQAG